jgi:hypothetical protein
MHKTLEKQNKIHSDCGGVIKEKYEYSRISRCVSCGESVIRNKIESLTVTQWSRKYFNKLTGKENKMSAVKSIFGCEEGDGFTVTPADQEKVIVLSLNELGYKEMAKRFDGFLCHNPELVKEVGGFISSIAKMAGRKTITERLSFYDIY